MKILRFVGRKAAFWFAVGACAGIALAGVELGLSYFIALLLQILGISNSRASLPLGLDLHISSIEGLALMLILLGLFRGGFKLLSAQSAAVAESVIDARLKLLSFYEILWLKRGYCSLADLNLRLSEVIPKTRSFCLTLALLIPLLLQTSLIGGYLLWQSPRLMLIGMAGMAIVAAIVFFVYRQVKGISERVLADNARINEAGVRLVRNWFLVKILRTEKVEQARIVSRSLSYSSSLLRTTFLTQVSAILPQVLGVFLFLALILQQAKHRTVEDLAFLGFIYLFMRFIQLCGDIAQSCGVLSSQYPQFASAMAFFGRFNRNDLHLAVDPVRALTLTGGTYVEPAAPRLSALAERDEGVPPSIEVRDVSFRYSEDAPWVLRGVSFSLPAGRQMGIVGSSGSGKSTLLALLLGVVEPTEGDVAVAKARLGYVGPEPFLQAGSLRDNLLYGAERAIEDEELVDSLVSVGMGDWLRAVPAGLDTVVSENGEGMSSGQKQRLSLARALLRRPSLLILDEISANLDEESERLVTELVHQLHEKCTVVIVSHRPAILKYADRVVELKDGQMRDLK